MVDRSTTTYRGTKDGFGGVLTRPTGRDDQIFDVRSWGAVGDGTTDDAPAIQTAIDKAFNAGGGEVYIPRPDTSYLIQSTINLKENVSVIGVPADSGIGGSTIKVGSNVSGKALEYVDSNDSQFTVKNLTVDCDNKTLSWCFDCPNVNESSIQNIKIVDVNGGGMRMSAQLHRLSDIDITVSGTPGEYGLVLSSTDNVYRNITVDGGQGVLDSFASGSAYLNFLIKNSNGSALTIDNTASNTFNGAWSNCTFKGYSDYGLRVEMAGDISSPKEVNGPFYLCDFQGGGTADVRMNDAQYVSFSKCNFQGSNALETANTVDFVSYWDCEFAQSSVPSPGGSSVADANNTSVGSFRSDPGTKEYVPSADLERIEKGEFLNGPDREYHFPEEYGGNNEDALQRAIDNANSGDAVIIPETITITSRIKTDVDLIGTYRGAILEANLSGDDVMIEVTGDDVTISRIRLQMLSGSDEANPMLLDRGNGTIISESEVMADQQNAVGVRVETDNTLITQSKLQTNGYETAIFDANDIDVVTSHIWSAFGTHGIFVKGGKTGIRIINNWMENIDQVSVLMEATGGEGLLLRGCHMAKGSQGSPFAFRAKNSSDVDFSNVSIEGITFRNMTDADPQIEGDNLDGLSVLGVSMSSAKGLFKLGGSSKNVEIRGCVGEDLQTSLDSDSTQWNQSANTVF